MKIKLIGAAIVLVLVAACSGGSGESNKNPSDLQDVSIETGSESDQSLDSYFPIDRTHLIAFDSINDNRIFRTLTEDGLIATAYGIKSNDGDIIDLTGLTVENEEGEYLELDVDSVSGDVELRAKNAIYKMSLNDSDILIIRVEVGNQFVEYEVISETGTANTHQPEILHATALKNVSFESRMAAINIPSVNIAVNGCSADIDNMSVRAFGDRGAYLNQFPTSKTGLENEYEVLLPGLSKFDARLADYSDKMITFLSNYSFTDITEVAEDRVLGTLTDIADRLVQRGISERTNLIDDLIDSDTFLDRLGGVPSSTIGTIAPSLERVALRGLKTILRFADIPGIIDESLMLGDAVASYIDLASSVFHDEVAFEVVVITKFGETIRSTRSDLVSSAGPYPDLAIDVPCKNIEKSLGGGTFNGTFNPNNEPQNQFNPPIPACRGGSSPVHISNVIVAVDMNTGDGNITFDAFQEYKEDYCLWDWSGSPFGRTVQLSGPIGDFPRVFSGSSGGTASWSWNIIVDKFYDVTATFNLNYSFGTHRGSYSGSL